MNKIVRIKFGSHLYGTDTPNSDLDYKGIFMPSKREIYLGNIPKSLTFNTKTGSGKNTNEDKDEEYYSLHYFLKLAMEGETVALDMLNAPFEFCEFFSVEGKKIWEELVLNRHNFYTKNLKAFLGYCRKQASKYGVKGSRLFDAEEVLNFLDGMMIDHHNYYELKMRDVWDELPEGENIQKTVDNKGIKMYEVCGRKIQETADIAYAHEIVKKFYDSYGERARLAKDNKNIDWKAISHAIRVAYEMKEIYEQGTITFPLKEAVLLKEVKTGLLDYTTEVAPLLEKLVDEVEILSLASNYPESVNRKFWDDFLVELIEEYINEIYL
jgi:hypothetical protein